MQMDSRRTEGERRTKRTEAERSGQGAVVASLRERQRALFARLRHWKYRRNMLRANRERSWSQHNNVLTFGAKLLNMHETLGIKTRSTFALCTALLRGRRRGHVSIYLSATVPPRARYREYPVQYLSRIVNNSRAIQSRWTGSRTKSEVVNDSHCVRD